MCTMLMFFPGLREAPKDCNQQLRCPKPTTTVGSSNPPKPAAKKSPPIRVSSATRAAAIHRLQARTKSFTHGHEEATKCKAKPTKDCLPAPHLPRRDKGKAYQSSIPRAPISRGSRRDCPASSRSDTQQILRLPTHCAVHPDSMSLCIAICKSSPAETNNTS